MRAAVACFAALAVTHLLGLRVDVGFISGTVPPTWGVMVGGVMYAACWFLGVVVAPVLLVSGAVLRGLRS
jgi:hypothetical protein